MSEKVTKTRAPSYWQLINILPAERFIRPEIQKKKKLPCD